MAGARYNSFKKGTIVIEGRRGSLVLSPREADMVLADLQVIYHKRNLDIPGDAYDDVKIGGTDD